MDVPCMCPPLVVTSSESGSDAVAACKSGSCIHLWYVGTWWGEQVQLQTMDGISQKVSEDLSNQANSRAL